jgi:transketolase
MKTDNRIFLVVGDLGFKLFDEIRNDLPNRFINCGAAEQAMMGISVGLALQGCIPFTYSITPFLLWRTAETIRNYVDRESVPVKMIGSGRDDCYMEDGFSHYCGDDYKLLECFENINCRWPDSADEIENLVDEMINNPKPYYLNLKR